MASVCFPDDFRHGRMLRYIAPLMERACRPTLSHAERWWQLSSEDPAQSIVLSMRFIFGLFIVVLPGSVSGNDGGKACSEEWYLPDAITVSDRTSGW